jgi:hydrogenase nickel incorporation protein HypB
MPVKTIQVTEKILASNAAVAQANREKLDAAGVFAINLISSPGSGKTSLVEATVKKLIPAFRIGMINGDTSPAAFDAERGARAGASAIHINTAGKCHLEALGTHATVLIASTPEGSDKPYKYPGSYRGVDALVLNKIDLLPFLDFDMDFFLRGVAELNPGLNTFPLSCRTKEGFHAWIDWIVANMVGPAVQPVLFS